MKSYIAIFNPVTFKIRNLDGTYDQIFMSFSDFRIGEPMKLENGRTILCKNEKDKLGMTLAFEIDDNNSEQQLQWLNANDFHIAKIYDSDFQINIAYVEKSVIADLRLGFTLFTFKNLEYTVEGRSHLQTYVYFNYENNVPSFRPLIN